MCVGFLLLLLIHITTLAATVLSLYYSIELALQRTSRFSRLPLSSAAAAAADGRQLTMQVTPIRRAAWSPKALKVSTKLQHGERLIVVPALLTTVSARI